MMTIMMLISISMSMMFLFLKHPMSMGMMLLIKSILIALITGSFSYNFWFSYIMFLIMIGGMLVLFIYMTSIASNEMFKYSNKLTLSAMIMIVTTILMSSIMDKMISDQNCLNTDSTLMNETIMFNLSLNKYLNFPSSTILFFMIIYLFITMIAVVKITNIENGPLRQKS